MTAVVLYIASSLDGYIATMDGGVEWLTAVEIEGEDYGFQTFFDSVDGLVMGSRTYEQILGFGKWPYRDKPSWVMSRQALKPAASSVLITPGTVDDVLAAAEQQGLKRVWLVGGSALIDAFERAGRIDECIISVVPLLLGNGLPLFVPGRRARALTLIESRHYTSGLVQLHYCAKTTNKQ